MPKIKKEGDCMLSRDGTTPILSVGSRLRLGTNVVLEITQIGKEDHPSIVSRTFGVSLLPSEGLFCKVINGGKIKKGDSVEIILIKEG